MIGLDFETYSATDLTKHGLVRYVSDPTFQVLLASVAHTNGAVNTIDFINDSEPVVKLNQQITGHTIVAHNAGFEKAVLKSLGIELDADQFLDSAVIARAAGAGGSLAAAAPQLLGADKLDGERTLIRLFCIPSTEQVEQGYLEFEDKLTWDNPNEWADFIHYCEMDAALSLNIATEWGHTITNAEGKYQTLTLKMNEAGWPVDMDIVHAMQAMYLYNQDEQLVQFQMQHDAHDLNLNSLKQLKEWCAERGIKASSFDEKHVAKLVTRIEDKLTVTGGLTEKQKKNYSDVLDLLKTKQILGGSSLKKLQVIIDTQHEGRLYDQYLHCGAGQTLRTTGRSVQMQNLKRLSTVRDMDELRDPDCEWSNEMLAENLRQVFTASQPGGALIVGDFSSVESRGLAWLAGEDWKLDSYRQGMDLYKVLASKIYGTPYESITKLQRQTGKVGELSCGYGAGPDAVVSFAEGMGVALEQGEATKLVWDWRDANPKIVALWSRLDEMLKRVVADDSQVRMPLADQYMLIFEAQKQPASLDLLIPHGVTVEMSITNPLQSAVVMQRYFHGCHERGRNICYFKPSDRKTGDLWKNTFIDPKTKQRRNYDLYGGKLAGILTQSLCREIFFRVLKDVDEWVDTSAQLTLVGQFHDEIVVDYKPGIVSLDTSMLGLKSIMSDAGMMSTFPLEADIKSDYRYTK
jgi:DNA polymerase